MKRLVALVVVVVLAVGMSAYAIEWTSEMMTTAKMKVEVEEKIENLQGKIDGGESLSDIEIELYSNYLCCLFETNGMMFLEIAASGLSEEAQENAKIMADSGYAMLQGLMAFREKYKNGEIDRAKYIDLLTGIWDSQKAED